MRTILVIIGLAFSLCTIGQNKTLRESKLNLLGIANDTIFKAQTKKAVISFDYTTGDLTLSFNPSNLSDNDPFVDSIVHNTFEGKVTFSGVIEKSIFDLYRKTKNDNENKLTGTLTINDIQQFCLVSYSLKAPYPGSDQFTGTNKGTEQPIKISLSIFFNPKDYNLQPEGYFGDPMEIEIVEGYLNRIN